MGTELPPLKKGTGESGFGGRKGEEQRDLIWHSARDPLKRRRRRRRRRRPFSSPHLTPLRWGYRKRRRRKGGKEPSKTIFVHTYGARLARQKNKNGLCSKTCGIGVIMQRKQQGFHPKVNL